MSIYKACDIRGVYGQDLTEAETERIGQAIGTMADGGDVIVGGDVRESTPTLKVSLTDGLVSTGARVVDIGIMPTPVFSFAVDSLRPAAAAMVTASHNPAEFNGLKFVVGEDVTGPETVAQVQQLAGGGEFRRGKGTVETRDVLSEYESSTGETARPWLADGRKPRMVVDAGNGCWSELAPRILGRLGFEVVPQFCEIDGRFPNRDPNPAHSGSLAALQEAVVSEEAALGVAFDGDGDRVVLVDESGHVVPSEYTACLMARDLLKDNPGGKVVYDLKSTSALADCVAKHGGVPLMERSGYAFIKRRMRAENAIFGAEVSGHFFYGFLNGRDDGLLSAIHAASLVASSGRSLGGLVSELPHYVITPDIRIPCDSGRIDAALRAIRDAATGEVSELDGVRIQYETGWGLARASVTEPLITLRFEGQSASQLEGIVRQFLAPVPDLERVVRAFLKTHGQV